jgi:glycosyltransferase involved in cell wall biosynthesis
MNVLQAIYHYRIGGGALQVAVDLARAARNDGHRVDIVGRDLPITAEVGGECFFTGRKLEDWWRLSKRLAQMHYDILHVHDRYCSLMVSLIPKAPPTIQTNHVAYRTHRHLTRFAPIVVGCSRSMDRHHEDFFGLPPQRRAHVPNGVFPPSISPERLHEVRTWLQEHAAGRHLCLTIARLTLQKGHAHLLEAIAQIDPGLRSQWCFIFAGDGELAPALRFQADRLGIAADVKFLGHTNAVPEWLSLGEAFVLPSLYEGLPLALLEAMALGLPCLASRVDGNTEVLHHRENGLLCSPADPADLAMGLTALLGDDALRRRLGEAAKADYVQNWTFERTWKQYEALYYRLANGASTTSPV